MTYQTTCVASFEIHYHRFLDPSGNPTQLLPAFANDISILVELYRMMLLTRTFDAKAIALQRTGKMGTYPSTLGQEAISVAMGSAMLREDVLCPYYREYGAQLTRGVRMEDILLYWGGDERGSDFKVCREDFPICVPIASQVLHATGVALAFKIRQQPRVAVAAIGDGGTSKGDFYEAINFAGVQHLPVVFVVNNNQWAISMPLSEQTATQTIAQKAIAGGVYGEQIDGNDVIAMKEAMQRALDKARQGGGATVIEALTYRMCDHTTADDARRYRPLEELESYKKQDPVIRLRTYLAAQGAWDEQKEKALIHELNEKVQAAAQNYLNIPVCAPETMFDYLYATLPNALKAQREEVKFFGGQRG